MNDFVDESNFVKLEKTVEEVLTENNLQAVLYFSKIQKHWEIIVGKPLAAKTSPVQLFKKKLVVNVEDAAYSHHLKYFERHILDLIASPEICGEGVVKKVVFKVGKSKSKKIEPKPDKIPVKLESSNNLPRDKKSRKTAEVIEDKKLQASFVRLMSQRVSKKQNLPNE